MIRLNSKFVITMRNVADLEQFDINQNYNAGNGFILYKRHFLKVFYLLVCGGELCSDRSDYFLTSVQETRASAPSFSLTSFSLKFHRFAASSGSEACEVSFPGCD
jgi:hypothetical protein